MIERILIGRIDITDNTDFVREIINQQNPDNVIINLDEDNIISGYPGVIQGTILLPPPEALMAEQESDQESYDMILNAYYASPEVILYVTGIIFSLYHGRNILMYYPDLNPAESITIPKILEQFVIKFGINIGILARTEGFYNLSYTPIWLNMMYTSTALGPYEYLSKFPLEMAIQEPEMMRLVNDLRPVGKTLKDQIDNIQRLKERLHTNPKTKEVFYKI